MKTMSYKIDIYSCGCKFCKSHLAYCIGTYTQSLKCQCGNVCNHWGVKKTETKHIHINHKLIKYLKWLYLEQDNDEDGFYASLGLYREILKTNYITAIKTTTTIEMITDKLCHMFTKKDVEKYCSNNDTSFMRSGLQDFMSKKVKLFGFDINADIGRFIHVLKPLLYPYVQFVQILRVLELKRPEVYSYITSDKDRMWWLKRCIDEMNEYIQFKPPEYMLSINEIFGAQFKQNKE